jgi:hypothetical protein
MRPRNVSSMQNWGGPFKERLELGVSNGVVQRGCPWIPALGLF